MKSFLFKVLRQILVNQKRMLEGMPQTDITRANVNNLIQEINNALYENTSDKSRIDWKAGDTAIIKDHWEGANQKLRVLGSAVFLKQWWVPVEDSEDDDPTFHKEAGLERVE